MSKSFLSYYILISSHNRFSIFYLCLSTTSCYLYFASQLEIIASFDCFEERPYIIDSVFLTIDFKRFSIDFEHLYKILQLIIKRQHSAKNFFQICIVSSSSVGGKDEGGSRDYKKSRLIFNSRLIRFTCIYNRSNVQEEKY